jgi:plastocyanin
MNPLSLALIAIVVVAGASFAVVKSTDNSNSKAGAGSTSQVQTRPNTIIYSDNGYNPSSLTVASGTRLTVKNESTQPMQFDSDPHPSHTDDPELNVGVLEPGQSATFTVSTKGRHGYHNHLNAIDTGVIIVR